MIAPLLTFARASKRCLTSQATSAIYSLMELELLGETLKNARTALNWSLREAEEKTGVSNAYLSQLECAKIKQPSPNVLHKLAEAYSLSYALVMEYTGYPVPEKAQFSTTEHRFMSRLGRTSNSEQKALVEYLRFLRTQKH
jgi:HTH-type transcriptional regulator, competence development regulator